MPNVYNMSPSPIYVEWTETPSTSDRRPSGSPAVGVGQISVSPYSTTHRTACYVYDLDEQLIWKGRLRPEDEIRVNNPLVTWQKPDIKVNQLQAFKSLYPDNSEIQAITFDQLIAHAQTREPHGADLEERPHSIKRRDSQWTDCDLKGITIAVDVVAICFGFANLMKKVDMVEYLNNLAPKEGVAARISALEKVIGDWEKGDIAKRIMTVMDVANTVRDDIPYIASALFSNLSFMDKVLFGILVLAEVVAFTETLGESQVVIVGFELGIGGAFLGEDIGIYVSSCVGGNHQQPPALKPEPDMTARGPFYISSLQSARRLVPSSNPSNPKVLSHLDKGTYGGGLVDQWWLESTGEPNIFYIRNSECNEYMVVGPNKQIVVTAKNTGAEGQWILESMGGNPNEGYESFHYRSKTGQGYLLPDRFESIFLVPYSQDNQLFTLLNWKIKQ